MARRYREIILHAGMSKTGSTSIQANCRRHAQVLSEHGIRYPRFKFGMQTFSNHSVPLAVMVSANPGQYALGLQRRYGDRVGELVEDCRRQFQVVLDEPGDTLLLSSERVAGFSEEDLLLLRRLLGRHTERLRVWLYLRSPTDVLVGILQERAKAGASPDPGAVVGRARTRFSLMKRVFAKELEVWDFHAAARAPGGLVQDFFRRLGVSEGAIGGLDLSLENARISLEAYWLMREVNRLLPKRADGSRRRAGDLGALECLPGQPLGLRDVAPEAVWQAARDEVAWFEQQSGFVFPDALEEKAATCWGEACLRALPACLAGLPRTEMRPVLGAFLAREAERLAQERPQTASDLLAISRELNPE